MTMNAVEAKFYAFKFNLPQYLLVGVANITVFIPRPYVFKIFLNILKIFPNTFSILKIFLRKLTILSSIKLRTLVVCFKAMEATV